MSCVRRRCEERGGKKKRRILLSWLRRGVWSPSLPSRRSRRDGQKKKNLANRQTKFWATCCHATLQEGRRGGEGYTKKKRDGGPTGRAKNCSRLRGWSSATLVRRNVRWLRGRTGEGGSQKSEGERKKVKLASFGCSLARVSLAALVRSRAWAEGGGGKKKEKE